MQSEKKCWMNQPTNQQIQESTNWLSTQQTV